LHKLKDRAEEGEDRARAHPDLVWENRTFGKLPAALRSQGFAASRSSFDFFADAAGAFPVLNIS